jgi:hypothetical protein
MCDALRDAELLTNALDEGFTGVLPLEAALAGYHRKRDRSTLADYQLNAVLARTMAAPEQLLRLRAEVRDDPAATRRLILKQQGVQEPDASYLEPVP